MKGIGVDIVQMTRFQKEEKQTQKLANRILTPNELEMFGKKKEKNLQLAQRYLAKRFAAKEAASKALGTGIAKGVTFQDFEVSNDEFGAPHMTFTGQALMSFNKKGCREINISISDEKDFAVAFVVID
ncbi:holo-ACP synthase [Marinicellulosiphila megalodicopiae]|uniref:holo-ACP synthase n=1 Tax=Marinicellulosiphila megalodicopiae TaxID=2724896 RepID=UPI003BAE5A7A